MFNFFQKKEEKSLKNILSNTISSLVGNVVSSAKNDYPDEFELEDIEALLIKADLGVELAVELVDKIKQEKIKSKDLKLFLKKEFEKILDETKNSQINFDKSKINVFFVVGVNGAGKTTLIGKLANKYKKEGNNVLLVAADTFRAAAEEQLDIWAKRADVDILRQDKGNSAALAYRGIELAKEKNYNVVIIDSAGRLQNKYNLIEELKKIKNVINNKIENNNLETILVIDGSQGQNAIEQAKIFSNAVDVTSIAITKLDGSYRGGIIFAIAKYLKIPAKLIGIGEGIGDIKEFNKEEFISALFD